MKQPLAPPAEDIRGDETIDIPSYVIYCELPIVKTCLLYTSPSPRDRQKSRMPSSA